MPSDNYIIVSGITKVEYSPDHQTVYAYVDSRHNITETERQQFTNVHAPRTVVFIKDK